ncbi:MAG: hypothetical protein ACOCQF_03955 [Halanaerobiaceae bacterium]
MAKDSKLSFKNREINKIKKLGQIISAILYIILIILIIGFNNSLLYITRMNLAILSELIFMAVPFLILFYAYRKLKFLYYSYIFSAGYFLLTFNIIKDVNTEALQQLGYSNIDILIALIGWAVLLVLMYLPWRYKRLKEIN